MKKIIPISTAALLVIFCFTIGIKSRLSHSTRLSTELKAQEASINPSSPATERKIELQVDQPTWKGLITNDSERGVQTYDNSKFRFLFPEGWHIASDNLPTGSLQVVDYDETAPGKDGMVPGADKIEIAIIASTADDFENAPAGKEITFYPGATAKFYTILLKNSSGKFIRLMQYGDKSKYSTLDDLVKTFKQY